MYKILLADDEGIVTDSLQYIIEKHFSGECEIKIAKNGRLAIELAESFQPDIAFLDIQMPGINGLKAMEEIRAHNSRVKILILTAYDNFDYVKEALHLGAADYLLKPINKKVIVERLTSLMSAIDASRQKRREDLQIKEKMEAVVPIIENGFVLSLIIQGEYRDSGEQYRRLLDIEEQYGMILVLEWGSGMEDGAMGNPIGSGVMAHRHYARMSELVKVYFKACVSNIMGNKLVCVLMTSQQQQEYGDRLHLIERTRELVNALKRTLGIAVRAGIGSPKAWDSMGESYHEALNALRRGKRAVTHIDDLIVKGNQEKQQQVMERVLLRAVFSGSEHDVRQEALVFADCVLQNQNCCFEEKKLRLTELAVLARRELQDQRNESQIVSAHMSQMMGAGDGEQLRLQFAETMTELAQAALLRESAPDDVIVRAQEYIRRNFRRDLALEEVAQSVGISPYYFSKLFKEETKINFTEYLTEIRIETAKRLLLNHELSIKQVCADSGYANPNYFSRIFKKWTGVTPTEFREGGPGAAARQ